MCISQERVPDALPSAVCCRRTWPLPARLGPPGDPWGASAAPMLSGCSALSLAHVCESVLITVCVIY